MHVEGQDGNAGGGGEFGGEERGERYASRVDALSPVIRDLFPEALIGIVAAEDDLFTVSENKRPNLEYYKNNAIHLFVPAAITALAILTKDAFQFSATDLNDTYRFSDAFSAEIVYAITP